MVIVEPMNKPRKKWYHVKPWSRHGLILTTAGITYIAIGVMFCSQEATELRSENLKLALEIMPYRGWGIGFIVVGIITVISARWPYAPKSLGYSVLTGWSTAWAGFHIFGGIETGNTAYVASGFSWAMVAFMWWAVSGLISPPKERTIGGVLTTRGHLAGCSNCGSVCVCDTETGLEGESASTERDPSGKDGDGSV
ncbi:membrane protein [Gordonia phage Secretariat]|uniref:Membrane protein n=1 Tax=Gordonia phage Secretariat TaxID=2725616 RepID=A0A6M3SWX2_9CAUD|nr:membrane protein [Gordonia phage Secretariat]QJD49660.1 membrane protein [Gordonia phage Secretariat]